MEIGGLVVEENLWGFESWIKMYEIFLYIIIFGMLEGRIRFI